MENTDTINMKLWRRSIPLSQADLFYAPKRLQEKWEIASKKSVTDAMQNGMETANKNAKSTLDFIGNLLESTQPIFSERSRIRSEARDILRAHIDNSRLLTLAFEAPRTMHSNPVELSPDYWHEFVSWDGGKIRLQGMEFIEVRILHPETAKRLRTEELPEQAQALNVGRPTVQPQITEAFTVLLEAGIIDLNSSMKTSFPPIQEWIKTHHPDALGDKDALNNETIRRTIAPLFKEAKSTSLKKQ